MNLNNVAEKFGYVIFSVSTYYFYMNFIFNMNKLLCYTAKKLGAIQLAEYHLLFIF